MPTPRNSGDQASVRLTPELLKRLDAWRAAQLVPPSRSATIATAVREFLKAVESLNEK